MKAIKKVLSISLIIPTFNDENTIISQVQACEKILQKYCKTYEIIIADDYSTDATRSLLKKNYATLPQYRLIFNKKNLGITKNVMSLYKLASKEYIIFYSADGDWIPGDIEYLIKTLIKNHSDIVIGKRLKKIGYTPYRKVISYFHKLLPLILFGVDTIDPGGIKIIKKKLAQIPFVSKSQFFEAEMIIRARKNGYIISWHPVTYKKIFYGSGYGGDLDSALRSVLDVIKLRFLLFFNS